MATGLGQCICSANNISCCTLLTPLCHYCLVDKSFFWQVKVKLFQTYCLCLHNPGLWHSFNKATMHRLYSCYNKCVKRFFGFAKYSSLTSALLQTGLPSCTTVIHNFTFRFHIMISTGRLHYQSGILINFDTNVSLQLNFVTVMNLCFKKVLINTTKSL